MATGGHTTQAAEAQTCNFGYKCIFEGDSSDYQCSSCKLLLRDGCVTTCCGQNYCKGFLEGKQNCPACHQDLHFYSNQFLNKTLQNQEVICIERENGCPWNGRIKDLDEHQSQCEYVHVLCENCQQTVVKIYINAHQQECPEREYSCPHCGEKSTYRFVTGTHIPLCRSAPVICPNSCGVAAERDILDNHVQNECPLGQVTCPFSYIGCDVKLKRGESERHMKEKVPAHLSALARYTLQLAAKMEDMKKTVEEQLRKRDGNQASYKERDKKRKGLEEDIDFLKKKVEVLSHTVNNPPDNEISPPELQDAEKIETANLQKKLEEKDAKINQLSKSLKVYREEQIKMEKRLLEIESLLNTTKPQNLSEQEQTATLIIQGFTKKKQNKESWTEYIFKDKPEMPQLVLTVWPNGQQEGKDTHVSVWLEHEDIQFQPGHIFVYFELLNQLADMSHVPVTCQFPIEERRYIGAISNTLIEHAALNYDPTMGTQYLAHDSLKFRVQVFIKFIEPPCWN